MVRNYKKRRESVIDEQAMKTAILQVINGRMKLRQAANIYNIKPSTLQHRVKKCKQDIPLKSKDFTTKYTANQVFTKEEERILKKYLLKSSEMNYGLTYKQARQLAYQYANALEKCPEKWTKSGEAGIEWLKGFMKRNNELPLRKSANTRLSRVTSTNKYNVVQFFNNYAKVLRKYGFTSDRIYNLDETNITAVVQVVDVIVRTEAKPVGQCASAEREQLITMCGIGNAVGNFIPPVFILPSALFHDFMIRGGPPGCVGYNDSSTNGSMNGPLFIKVLEHIKERVKCSNQDPILLLMDNHESHCTLEAINYCRENGMVVVTFPPHCTHRFQPLDVAVNESFKQKLVVAQNDWLVNHPGKTMTIHDLVGIVTLAYNVTYTASNMVAGFAMSGIHPFSRTVFSDGKFECVELTNRPLPQAPSISAHAISVYTQHSPIISAAAEDNDKADCEDSDSEQEINVNDGSPSITASAYLSTTTANLPLETSNSSLTVTASKLPTPLSKTTPVLSETAVVPLTVTSSLPLVSLPGHSNVFTVTNSEAPIITVSCLATSPQTSEIPATSSSQTITLNKMKTPSERVVDQNIITPDQIRPFPKAHPRIQSNKGRKANTRIFTYTPEIDEIQKVYLESQVRLEKSREKISDQKKRKYSNLDYSESGRSKGSKHKTTRRKRTKTIVTYSSDGTETEMDLGSKNEAKMHCEENVDMNDCDEEYEKEFDCGVLNPEDFVVAHNSSENNKRSLVGLLEVTKPRLATSRANIETNKEDHTNILSEESMSTENETFSTKNENSCISDTIESNNGEDEIAFEDVKLEAPSYYSPFMSLTARDVINVAPEALVWTRKLNSLHPTIRLYVEKAINDIVFEAELGNISKDSVKINGK